METKSVGQKLISILKEKKQRVEDIYKKLPPWELQDSRLVYLKGQKRKTCQCPSDK